jgi:hypothetical protein
MTDPLSLDTLRAQGADRHDPARFHFLSVLARRMATQTPAVQQLLAPRLAQAVAAYADSALAGGAARAPGSNHTSGAVPAVRPIPSPLAQLVQALQPQTLINSPAHTEGEPLPRMLADDDRASMADLPSVRRFSEVWSKISAQQQVDLALGRGPENAGPLNSHQLMLRTLTLMRTLSPDYLRRFLSQMDALLWLGQTPTAGPAKRRSRKG